MIKEIHKYVILVLKILLLKRNWDKLHLILIRKIIISQMRYNVNRVYVNRRATKKNSSCLPKDYRKEVKILGKKIQKLLDEHNVTAYQLSKDTGIPYSCIADYRSGRSKPKLDKLKKIADYFGVPLEYFLEK
jgi:ribosome-binding protein aMBF1 (putative translation factor)